MNRVELSEAALGASFFFDEREQVIRDDLLSQESRIIAEQNPYRRAVFDDIVRTAINARGNDGSAIEDVALDLEAARRMIRLTNRFESFVVKKDEGAKGTVLRDHQLDVFHSLESYLLDAPDTENFGKQRGSIVMATGSGKTALFIELSKAFLTPANEEDAVQEKVLILVPRQTLVEQTIGDKSNKGGFAKFAPEIHVTGYYGKEKSLEGDVVVMTYDSFNNAMRDGSLQQHKFSTMFADESHMSLGKTTSQNIEEFSEGKLCIGFTASDELAGGRSVDELFPVEIHRLELRESIENKILHPVQGWAHKSEYALDPTVSGADFSEADLAKLIDQEANNQDAVKYAREFVDKGMQGVIACSPGDDCRHAKEMAERLNKEVTVVDGVERNIAAVAVDGSTKNINEINTLYTEGKIDVICFVDLLTAGWDNPPAKFLLNLRPTLSPAVAIQRLGRILRPTDIEWPAIVVDFIYGENATSYTYAHVLGLDSYDTSTIIGGKKSDGTPSDYVPPIKPHELPADLAEKLVMLEGHQIDRVTLGKSNEYELPPENWLRTTDACKQLGLTQYALRSRLALINAAEIGLSGRYKPEREFPGTYVSPDAIAVLSDPEAYLALANEQRSMPCVPPDFVSLSTIHADIKKLTEGTEISVGIKRIISVSTSNNILGAEYSFLTNAKRTGMFYSPGEASQIKALAISAAKLQESERERKAVIKDEARAILESHLDNGKRVSLAGIWSQTFKTSYTSIKDMMLEGIEAEEIDVPGVGIVKTVSAADYEEMHWRWENGEPKTKNLISTRQLGSATGFPLDFLENSKELANFIEGNESGRWLIGPKRTNEQYFEPADVAGFKDDLEGRYSTPDRIAAELGVKVEWIHQVAQVLGQRAKSKPSYLMVKPVYTKPEAEKLKMLLRRVINPGSEITT